MPYFIYCRKSEEDEGRQVQSIGDQLSSCRELVSREGLAVKEILVESMSAKRPGRPVFDTMIKRIEQGEADGIIAWHPDRLSRNAVDAGKIIDLLDRGRLDDLKFQSYRFENSPEGKWMLSIVLGQSKYFVDKLSKDVKRGLQSKVQKGHYPGRALPGYVNDLEKHIIVADTLRFPLMRRAIELLLTGSCSVPHVLDILNNEWGFRTKATKKSGGGPLSRSVFYELLSNPFCTGNILYKGQTYQGQHPPLVTHDEFERIQEILGKSRTRPRLLQSAFCGMIRCAACGCSIVHERKTKVYRGTGRTVHYSYYHCSNGKGGCNKRSVSEEYITQQIEVLLKSLHVCPELREWLDQASDSWCAKGMDRTGAAKKNLINAADGARRRLRNLLDARLEDPDLYTPAEFKAEKARLNTEITSLEMHAEAASERMDSAGRSTINAIRFAVEANYRFTNGSAEVRRHIAKQIAESYYLNLGNLVIKPHPLLAFFLTIEPRETDYAKQKGQSFLVDNPTWLGIPDAIRNLIIENDLSFPAVGANLF